MDAKELIKRCKEDIVFFAEHLIRNESGGFYKLEEHQKAFLTSEDNYLLFFCGRRLGKSFSLAIMALHQAIFNKFQNIFILSPSESQAKEFARTLSGLIERSEVILNEVEVDNVLEKRFRNKSRIAVRTVGGKGSVSSVIGSGVNMLILDELQDMGGGTTEGASDNILQKVLPIVRGQTGTARLITAGTPRNRAGILFESYISSPKVWNNGKIETYPENDGIFTVFKKQTAYLNEEDQVIATGTPRITIEELEDDKKMMSLIEFKQEYCLEFLSSLSDVYYQELQDIAFYTPKENIPFKTKKPVCAGIDLGKTRNNTVLTLAEVDPDTNKLDVKYFKEFPLGTDYKDIIDYLAFELPKLFPNILRMVVDATGVGVAVFEQLEEKVKMRLRSYPLEPFKFTKETKKELVESGVAVLEREAANIAYNRRLKEEMDGYKRQLTDTGAIVYKKNPSDDYIDSLNLCLYNTILGLNLRVPLFFKEIPQSVQRSYGEQTWQRPKPKSKPKSKIMNQIRRRL